LIDAQSGAHVWSERYDRPAQDIFAVQKEIATKIAAAIAGGNWAGIQTAEGERVKKLSAEQMKAYDHVVRAMFVEEWWHAAGYSKAKSELQKAIELDSSYARARSEYAWIVLIGWIFQFEKSLAPPEEIKQNAIRAVQLDINVSVCPSNGRIWLFFLQTIPSV
jgi:hypothetical protein